MTSFVHLEAVLALDKFMEETFPIDSRSLVLKKNNSL